MSESKVQVFVRIRPMLKRYGEEFCIQCARKTSEDTIAMSHPTDDSANSGKTHSFAYNCVFDGEDSQEDLYEAVKALVDSTLDGHSATIFTYGQTGSGKTHTVLGEVSKAEEGEEMRIGPSTGLFMRVLDDLLKYKHANSKHSHVVIALSILEIHNEEIRDLLKNCKTLTLQKNRHGDEGIPNVTLREVNSLQHCFKVYQIGTAHRSVAATNMNADSSRSHAVFQIEVVQQEKTERNPDPPNIVDLYQEDFAANGSKTDGSFPVKRSRLCLVDLAGSERLKKSGAEGATLKETQAINTSLTCLGNVVNALFENKSFINYRDSKLTLLLKPSFERQNAKILLIANISPIEASYSESVGSLRFADRVMNLKASKGFAIDAHAEGEYMECLRAQAELAADLRIAIAAHDLKLVGGRRLKEMKSTKGTFAKDTLNLLTEEAKQYQKKAQEKELQRFIDKIVLKRSAMEKRESRITQELGWQLQIEEQELLETDCLNEQICHQESQSIQKEGYKGIKVISKQCTKNHDKMVAQQTKLVAEYDRILAEGTTVCNSTNDTEMQFAENGTLPSDVAALLPPPEQDSQKEKTIDTERATSPASEANKNQASSERSPPSPSTAQSGYSSVGSDGTHNKSSPSKSDCAMEELQTASKTTNELAKRREEATRSWEQRYTELKNMAASTQQKSKKEDADDEDDEDMPTPFSRGKTKTQKSDQVSLDIKRQKELLKASGLSKEQVKTLLSLQGH